jgi:hypothetical protein
MINTHKDDRWTPIRSIVLVGVAAFLSGCGQSDQAGPKVAVAPQPQASSPALSAGPSAKPPDSPVALLSAAKAEAESFLKLLPADVPGASAKLAVAFKKTVTGSLTYEDEKKLGYSESDTHKYLKEASAGVTGWRLQTAVAAPSGTDFSLRGEATKSDGPARFAVRVAKSGDAWQVTRFAVTKATSEVSAKPDADAEQIWVRETALDFLDALIGSDPDHALTMAAMTEACKKRVPDKFPADPGLGYAKRDVRNWLNGLRQGVTGYAVTSQTVDAKGRTFAGQLRGAGTARSFMLWAAADPDGAWKVDNFVVE